MASRSPLDALSGGRCCLFCEHILGHIQCGEEFRVCRYLYSRQRDGGSLYSVPAADPAVRRDFVYMLASSLTERS